MKTVLYLLKEIRQVKWLFFFSTLLYLVAAVIQRWAPFILQELIDGPLTALSQGQFQAQEAIGQSLLVYLFWSVVMSLLSYSSTFMLLHSCQLITENLRNRAYRVMQALPVSYFDDKPAGSISTRIVNDTETLRQQFYSTLVMIFSNLVRLLMVYGALFYLNPLLAFLLLGLIPLYAGIQHLYKKVSTQPITDYYEARSEINTQINETINGISLIQLLGQEERVLSDFEAATDTMRRSNNRMVFFNALGNWNLSGFLQQLMVTGVLTIIGSQFLKGHTTLSSGHLFLYITYIEGLFVPLGNLLQHFPNLLHSVETGKRVQDLLEEEQELDADALLEVEEGEVCFDGVSFGYEPGQQVLTDIQFTVKKGETLALVGHTGSGKSSIMNLLYRFYDPQEGEIRIDGKPIQNYSRESLRSHMGIVLQEPYLFTGTIASNVAMKASDRDRKAIRTALEKVGAGPLLTKLAKGIDEPVQEKGATFSSGERQLLSFARTLYADPKILILDEATAHVDTETEEIIQHAMRVVKEGRTTLMIAHRLSTIQHADQILVLDKGRIVEKGTHEQLLDQGGIYAHMYQIQQGEEG